MRTMFRKRILITCRMRSFPLILHSDPHLTFCLRNAKASRSSCIVVSKMQKWAQSDSLLHTLFASQLRVQTANSQTAPHRPLIHKLHERSLKLGIICFSRKDGVQSKIIWHLLTQSTTVDQGTCEWTAFSPSFTPLRHSWLKERSIQREYYTSTWVQLTIKIIEFC